MPLAANGIWYADQRTTAAPYPPVLLLHGAGGTHLDWPAELRRLPNSLAPDLADHGRSTTPFRSSIPAMAADMIALLDELNIEQAVLLGHSMGGAVALQIALDYPERTAGLILIATGARLAVHPDILNGLLPETLKAVQLLVNWQWADGFDEALESGFARLMQIQPALLHADYTATNDFDVRERLGEIHTPTLVIGGTADRMTPLRYSEYLRDHIPNAQLIVIDGGGHMLTLEQPQPVGAAIKTFLETLCKN